MKIIHTSVQLLYGMQAKGWKGGEDTDVLGRVCGVCGLAATGRRQRAPCTSPTHFLSSFSVDGTSLSRPSVTNASNTSDCTNDLSPEISEQSLLQITHNDEKILQTSHDTNYTFNFSRTFSKFGFLFLPWMPHLYLEPVPSSESQLLLDPCTLFQTSSSTRILFLFGSLFLLQNCLPFQITVPYLDAHSLFGPSFVTLICNSVSLNITE